jgi:hypothetical protein
MVGQLLLFTTVVERGRRWSRRELGATSGNIAPVIYRNKNYQKLMFGRYVIGQMDGNAILRWQ